MMIQAKTRVQKPSTFEPANNDEDNDNNEIGRKNAAYSNELLFTMKLKILYKKLSDRSRETDRLIDWETDSLRD